MSTNGNQRLFTDGCLINGDVSATKTNFPQNSCYSALTSSVSMMRHTPTNSTPPKITNTLTKSSITVHHHWIQRHQSHHRQTEEEDSTPFHCDALPSESDTSRHWNKSVIKPIAFKPLSRRINDNEGHQYGSTPILTRPSFHIPHYGSSSDLLRQSSHSYVPIERKLRSASPIAMSSLPFSVNRKLRNDYDSLDGINLRKTPPSHHNFKDSGTYSKSSFRSIDRVTNSEGSGSMLDLTSSPCDSSSFAEMEVALRERDYELSYLRQTMEHNEQVIFKVYQEKEHAYERELRRLKALHESRLRAAAQKSLKLEQMLMIQTYQLQEEKKRLKEENAEATGEISALREEIDALRLRLEETEWKLCQKSGELTLLKSQTENLKDDQEVSNLKNEMRQLKANLLTKDAKIEELQEQLNKSGITDHTVQSEVFKLLGQLENEVTNDEQKYSKIEADKINEEKTPREDAISLIDKIKLKISNVIKKFHEERSSWENERATWLTEKQRVLLFQKHLQMSYVEMFRRNKSLEAGMENLALELHLNGKSHSKKSLAHTAIQL